MTSSLVLRVLCGLLCGALVACGGESPGPTSPAVGGGAGNSDGGAVTAGTTAGNAIGGAAPGAGGGEGTGTAGAATTGGAATGGNGGGGVGAGTGSGGTNAGGGGSAGVNNGGAPAVCTGTPSKAVTVYMIGDSTMSVYAANLAPRMGWGQPLGDSFAPACATVVDKAISGRSSKSFFDEGAWTPVKNALKGGDYVLIQFGHNDEKTEDPLRYTEPQTTYKQYLTTYITDARAKMATPLLLTPINRNSWSGTTVSNSHGLYPAAVRELAASLKVELIDLTALTKAYFERIGQAETAKLFLILGAGESPNYPTGVADNTHLQEKGARLVGQLALADAYAQKLTLASLLKAAAVAP